MSAWLWPDRTIGKRESRKLREEHNALVNSQAELLEALLALRLYYGEDSGDVWVQANAAIKKAGG